MEETSAGKRLFVGGLSHSVCEKELRERFAKFGPVSHVDIITRRDDAGTPLRTFGYININISDSDLRKCMTVLNKSKWKGGTLQIEMAKESFLQRLAQERQQMTENAVRRSATPRETLVDSFRKAGVENFHMKAAVPGTEIPGHKNWVVSKFGRVLPVLHLKARHKNKIFKYDPSKHSHNIKKLDAEVGASTPVSELTWEIAGGDDDMSKKRRGEFPPQTAALAKMRRNSKAKMMVASGSEPTCNEQKGPCDPLERSWMSPKVNFNGYFQGLQSRMTQNGTGDKKQNAAMKKQQQGPSHMLDNDTDSEDEIKMLVEADSAHSRLMAAADEDHLEVVGEDYVVTPHMLCGKMPAARSDCEQDYDSADTDEIVIRGKDSHSIAEKICIEKLNGNCSKSLSLPAKKTELKSVEIKARHVSHLTNDSDSSSDGDGDYEATMANCYRLDLSLADLENLAKQHWDSSDEESSEYQEADSPTSSPHCPTVAIMQQAKNHSLSAKKANNPDDILAAILAESSSDEERNKKRNKKKPCPSLPAFMGTKSLMEDTRKAESSLDHKKEKDDNCGRRVSVVKPKLEFSASGVKKSSQSQTDSKHSQRTAVDVGSPAVKDDVGKWRDRSPIKVISTELQRKELQFDTSTSEDEESEQADKQNGTTIAPPRGTSTQLCNSQANVQEGATQNSSASCLEPVQKPVPDCSHKRQEDNQRRLAALQLRQKEAEEQKRLIQGALSCLDTPTPSKGKHIVFNSDSESEGDQTPEQTSSNTHLPLRTLLDRSTTSPEDGTSEKEFQKGGNSKLFLSSDEEEEDEEDAERFQIKPQFEGKAGQKLMELQSRFGTDERFRMDSRFLENDDEEDSDEEKFASDAVDLHLEGEKKKNLEILQSLLHIDIKAAKAGREAVKGKTFRDISALHYDPTRDEHAAFETEKKQSKNESKAEKRKKRKLAEEVPEVSKDIFYSVTADLKEVFVSKKEGNKQKHIVAWDQEEVPPSHTAGNDPTAPVGVEPEAVQHSAEFKFSFFEDEPDRDSLMKESYKVETLQRPKMSWHADHRFQDSSSEEEDVDEEHKEAEDESAQTLTLKAPVQTKKTFFFFQDDERLKEGPRTFCRTETLEEQREQWEEKRVSLIEEYRMKHKSAKRRGKIALKT